MASRRRQRGGDLESFTYQGIQRHYIVRAPAGGTRSGEGLPVVLVLHGGGGNANNAESMTGFTRLVERERIIVVYPEGTSKRARLRLDTWNAAHCCGSAMTERVDDVGFIDALLDTLAAHYPIDPNRLYATGMSNGGMMAHRLGRELRHPLAAIAPVVGAVFGDEPPPAHPVSALMINGLLDQSVPPAGGLSKGRGESAWDGTPMRPQTAQGEFWAKANGCRPEPRKETRGVVVHWSYECPLVARWSGTSSPTWGMPGPAGSVGVVWAMRRAPRSRLPRSSGRSSSRIRVRDRWKRGRRRGRASASITFT